MYKHILVATDLSPRASNALKHAIKFAHIFNSKITLLNVHEEFMNKEEMIMSMVSVGKMQNLLKIYQLKQKSKLVI